MPYIHYVEGERRIYAWGETQADSWEMLRAKRQVNSKVFAVRMDEWRLVECTRKMMDELCANPDPLARRRWVLRDGVATSDVGE